MTICVFKLSATIRNFYRVATVFSTNLVKLKLRTDQYKENVHKTWGHTDKLVAKPEFFKRELS